MPYGCFFWDPDGCYGCLMDALWIYGSEGSDIFVATNMVSLFLVVPMDALDALWMLRALYMDAFSMDSARLGAYGCCGCFMDAYI